MELQLFWTGGRVAAMIGPVRADLPSGTVTFLFTDVVGSTKLLQELGADAYVGVLAEHRRVVRKACAEQSGVEVDVQGDAFFFAFPTAPGAIEAARVISEAVSGPMRVRIGVHTGTPVVTGDGYVGPDVHRAARIAAAGNGGQVLVSASTVALVGSRGLRDLGEHRFKDLSAPERVYQLGEGDFPPLRSLYRSDLPVPATAFVGRDRELAEVVQLLVRPDLRLLTLTGPGGTGKTRLALQAAAETAECFPDGVWWVPLAPVREPSLLLSAVAHVLEVKEERGDDLADTLSAALVGKRALLLLDNAEHLLPEAARQIAMLCSASGPLLLVTSRERLQVHSERLYPVPALAERDAVELFVARARALEPSFEADGAVRELCARLDYLPLALELAAARTVVFSAGQLLERLSQRLDLLKGARDADPRQQTLRATIAWSYALLDPEQQRLFRSLSVFASGCTYEAAETMCEADPDSLQSLIDKSLLRRRDSEFGPRYSMLETIREFAAERLDEKGEAFAIHLRHAEWYCDLAERLVGPGPARPSNESFGAFPDDYGNTRSALAWTRSAGEDELSLRLGAACWRYWMLHGPFHDAVSWLEQARPRIHAAPLPVRLQARKTAGFVAFFLLGDSKEADAFGQEALADAEELGDAQEIAWIEEFRAASTWEQGDFEAALMMQERNLSKARESGDRFREARSLHLLGEVLRDLGRFDEGEAALLTAGAIYRESGPDFLLSGNTHSLADLALDRGDLDLALQRYRESLDSDLLAGRQRDAAYCLAGLACVLAERGRDEAAAKVWGAVCAAEETLGFRMLDIERRRYETRLAHLEPTAAWEAGKTLTLKEAQLICDG